MSGTSGQHLGDTPAASSDRLDSWKEIAAHLKRNVRTVQRWERTENLPIHRHLHSARGSVYASAAELDRWWRERAGALALQDRSDSTRRAGGSRRVRSIAAVAILVVATVGIATWGPAQRAGQAQLRTIAVLPFKPLVPSEADDRLQLGLTEEVIGQLSRIKGLRIEPLAKVRRFGSLEQDPLEAGKRLDVDAVLEGHFQLTGSIVHVRTRLLRTNDGTALAINQWDDPFRSIPALQGRLAESIADALGVRLMAGERSHIRGPETANPEAFRHYLFGRYHLEVRSGNRMLDAEREFNEALKLDPSYARAHAGLSMALISMAWLGSRPAVDVMGPARAAAQRALALDDSVALGHTALAYIHDYMDYNPAAAQAEHLRAVALDDRDLWVLRAYASFLMRRDAFDEALAVIDKAIALDPTAPLSIRHKAMILYVARRYDECINESRKTITLDPDNYTLAYSWLAVCLEQQGKRREAVDAYGQMLIARGDRGLAKQLQQVYNAGGWEAYWREYLRTETDAEFSAAAHARVGNIDAALRHLERGYEARAPWINNSNYPRWDPIRSDRRFQELRARTGRSDDINAKLAVIRRAARPRVTE